MTRTQIQLPNSLYNKTKNIAVMLEMSFAEVTRRALEQYTSRYEDKTPKAEWKMPEPKSMGMKIDLAKANRAEVDYAYDKYLVAAEEMAEFQHKKKK